MLRWVNHVFNRSLDKSSGSLKRCQTGTIPGDECNYKSVIGGWINSVFIVSYPTFLWDKIQQVDSSESLVLLITQKLVIYISVHCILYLNGNFALIRGAKNAEDWSPIQ